MEDKSEKKELQIPTEGRMKFFMKPGNFTRVVSGKKAVWGFWTLFGYIGHFFLIVIGINLYSDVDRLLKCGEGQYKGDPKSSEVYDTALLLLIIYHLIEWVRIIVFGVCVVIGANLMSIYYATSLNTLFGIAAYCYAHSARFNEHGKACAEVQTYRADFLLAEVIIFWTCFFPMSLPWVMMKMMKAETLDKAFKGGSDNEEEGSGEEGEDGKKGTDK